MTDAQTDAPTGDTTSAVADNGSGVTRRRGGWAPAAWLAISMLAGAALALRLGQDASGDQLQSHAMGAWFALHPHQDLGSIGKVLPTLWGAPWLLLTDHASTNQVLAVLGAVHGLVWWLSGAVAWTLFAGASRGTRRLLTGLSVTFSVIAPATLTEFGTTFGNLLTGLPVLLAVLLIVRSGRDLSSAPWGRLLLAGALLGLATGLKLTNAPFLVAGVAGVAVAPAVWRTRVQAALRCAVGALIGAVAGGGYLWVRFAREFSNPIYPYYDGLFDKLLGTTGANGTAAIAGSGRDVRYAVGNPWDLVTLPWRMATVSGYPSELPARDPRWAVLATVAVVVVVLVASRRGPRLPSAEPTTVRFLIVFTTVAWVLWAVQFGSVRYLVVLEQLTGPLLILLLWRIARRPVRVAALGALAAAATAATVIVPAFPSNHSPGPTWYSFRSGSLTEMPRTMATFPTDDDLNYMILAFPDDTQFVELSSFVPLDGRTTSLADTAIGRDISAHKGPVVAVVQRKQLADSEVIAARFGFRQDTGRCQPLTSSFFDALVCPWTVT